MPPLPADSIHARACKLKCEKILTRPYAAGSDVLVALDGSQALQEPADFAVMAGA